MDLEHRLNLVDEDAPGSSSPQTKLLGAGSQVDELDPGQMSPSGSSSRWSSVQFSSRSPGSRVFPSAVVHENTLYVFGGHDGAVYRNDLIIFSLETYSWLLDVEVIGEGPSPRDAHAAVVHDEWMYVFGGYDSKRYLNDYHRFHFATHTWSTVDYVGGGPSPRGGVSVASAQPYA